MLIGCTLRICFVAKLHIKFKSFQGWFFRWKKKEQRRKTIKMCLWKQKLFNIHINDRFFMHKQITYYIPMVMCCTKYFLSMRILASNILIPNSWFSSKKMLFFSIHMNLEVEMYDHKIFRKNDNEMRWHIDFCA